MAPKRTQAERDRISDQVTEDARRLARERRTARFGRPVITPATETNPAPITVTAQDGSTKLEKPVTSTTPTKRKPKTKRRRKSNRSRAYRQLTAAEAAQVREAAERRLEVERRRQIIIARAEAMTPLPYDNTGRPAALETGSNR